MNPAAIAALREMRIQCEVAKCKGTMRVVAREQRWEHERVGVRRRSAFLDSAEGGHEANGLSFFILTDRRSVSKTRE